MQRIRSLALLTAICLLGLPTTGCGGGGGGGGGAIPVVPVTVAFTRTGPSATTAFRVDFDVDFSTAVLNVDPTDFVVATTGSASADALVRVGDAGDADDATYVVTVVHLYPLGTVGLGLAAANDIVNAAGTAVTLTPTTSETYDRQDHCTQPTGAPGNVVAETFGMDLILTPDGGNNTITIFSDMSGDIIVEGVGGTTVNLGTQFVVPFVVPQTVPGDFTIHSSAGTLVVNIADLRVVGRARVTCCGMGANMVSIRDSQFEDLLSLVGGDGPDTFSIVSTSIGAATLIDGAGGSDSIDLLGTDHLAALDVLGGGGGDILTGNDVDVNDMLTVDMGAGADVIDCVALQAMGDSSIVLGANDDAARFVNSSFDGTAAMPVTAGNNVFDIEGTVFSGDLTIEATAGALCVRIKNDTFDAAVSLIGGPGATDVLLDNATSMFAVMPTVSGFEDLTNTHIDALFADLLGLVFP